MTLCRLAMPGRLMASPWISRLAVSMGAVGGWAGRRPRALFGRWIVTGQSQAQHPVASAEPRPGPNLLRDWRSIFFAPVGDGQRRRRGSDGLRLAGAILALVCCVLVIRYDSRID